MITTPRLWGPLACAVALVSLGACRSPAEPEVEPPSPDITPPVVSITDPTSDALIVDHRRSITVAATDSVGVTKVELSVDGAPYDVDLSAPWEFVWDNAGHPEHDCVLSVKAYDAAGNTASDQVTVRIRDVVFVTAIEVTNETDGVFDQNLEVEVHLFDVGDGAHLGCAGEQTGLAGVNVSDARYPTEAYFMAPDGTVMLMDNIAQRNLRVVVAEDDLLSCPDPPGSWDDLIGTFEPLPASDLPRVLSFGDVVHLALASGRRG